MRKSPASGLLVGRWDPLTRRPSSPIPGACRASPTPQPGILDPLGSDPRGGAARDTAPVPPWGAPAIRGSRAGILQRGSSPRATITLLHETGAPGTVTVPGIVNGGDLRC